MSTFEAIGTFWLTGWDAHPERVALLVLVLLSYGLGVRRYSAGRPWRKQAAWFGLGMALLVLSVQSPLHHLADHYLYSAHMVQHQLLTLVVPPILLLGIPPWLADPLLNRAWIRRFGQSQYFAPAAFAIFNVPFALIHAPSVYDALFANELLHFLTHGVLVTTALVTWMPFFSPAPTLVRRLSLPGQMLYCVAQSIPGSLVGSLITLSERIEYRHYGVAPLLLGVNPLEDQQLGGLLMWVGTGTFFLVLLTVLFFIWAEREETHAFG